MASEAVIEALIVALVAARGAGYGAWTIGVTDDLARRKGEHGNPFVWHDWNADTELAARNVEAYFQAKYMKGGPGGPGSANYVYIFI